MMLPRIALTAALTFAPHMAGAATPAATAALAVADNFVIPHYRALAGAADAQARAWQTFCAQGGRGGDAPLRAAYNALADRWAEVEFLKSGPMSLFLRRERFAYWPELHNATTAGLTALLAAKDDSAFTPQRLMFDNIPAQGLPAVERLLYDPQFRTHPDRCRVGRGLAKNLAAIAHDVLAAWTGPDGVRAAIAADRPWNDGVLANAGEAAGMLATDLAGAITFIDDQKLLAPMGASPALAKPRLAEAWRSGRSVRNLYLNVAALRQMERVFAAPMNRAERRRLDSAFDAALVAVRALPNDLPWAVADAGGRARIAAARTALKAAQAAFVTLVPKALNITLGFNSLDGD